MSAPLRYVLLLLMSGVLVVHYDPELFVFGNQFKIKNLVCVSYDKKLLEFRHCYIKAIKRGVIAAFVHMENHGRDLYNLTMNFAILRKANVLYRPFLYNISVDGCKMVQSFRSNPVLQIIYDAGRLSPEIIHQCPYNHDIIFEKFIIRERFLDKLPVPAGDYALVISLKVYNVLKVEVYGYATLTEN